jgi:hypothetical protein
LESEARASIVPLLFSWDLVLYDGFAQCLAIEHDEPGGLLLECDGKLIGKHHTVLTLEAAGVGEIETRTLRFAPSYFGFS